MKPFRVYLVLVIASLDSYTLLVGIEHGWNLLPIFFSDIAALTWPGQFNFDFLMFLTLAALWVAWRNQFSRAGMALAVLAFFGGMMFLAPYLLFVSLRAKDGVKTMLLGEKHIRA